MVVEQIYQMVNDAAREALGGTAITVKDTGSLVSLGDQVYSSDKNVEQFYRCLTDRIGRTVIAVRTYDRRRSPIRRDNMEYGIILQKISFDLPDAVTNPVWIFDQQKSPYDIETHTKVTQRLFSAMAAFSYEDKIPTKQLKHAFTSPVVMANFISGIYITWNNIYSLALENLDKLAVNTGIAATLGSSKTTIKYNPLADYKKLFDSTMTAEKALYSREFLEFATYMIDVVMDNMSEYRRLYNVDGFARFTPKDRMVVQILSRFGKSVSRRLYSNTFHEELVKMPNYVPVTSWQGAGESDSFEDVSKINITFNQPSGEGQTTKKTVEQSGIIAYIHDIDQIATTVYDESIVSEPNNFSKVINYQHEASLGYLFDPSENGVVFYIDDSDTQSYQSITAPESKNILDGIKEKFSK